MFRINSFYLFLVLLASSTIAAQTPYCTQDYLLTVKGSWKKKDDFMWPGKNYTADMKPEISKRLDKIEQVIQASYEPKGATVTWYHSIMGTPLIRSGAVTYSLTNYVFELYCNEHHQTLASDETGTNINIYVNNFGNYLTYDTSMRVGNLYVGLMYSRIGTMKGLDLFQTSLIRGNEHFVIISRNGQLPYTPLTRRQYLTVLKQKLQKEEASLIQRSTATAKDDAHRQTAQQYWQSHYDPQIKPIDDYLANASNDDLDQLAFVKDMINFKKFYTEKEGGRMPVILNKNYFNVTEAAWCPRMLLVYWSWNDGEGPAGGLLRPVAPDMNVCCKVTKYFKESVEQNLDVNALQQMIDK